MEDNRLDAFATEAPDGTVRNIMRDVIAEFLRAEQAKSEPAYKTELVEERRRREGLEKRINELEDETRRVRSRAEETERHATIRTELQKLGVQKVDLAFKAVKDEIQRAEDGRLIAKLGGDELPLADYLLHFVNENAELLPARIAGGSGARGGSRSVPVPPAPPIDLDKIHPGMTFEELERVRQEIARLANQSFRGV
jgi:hypothetical protein